MFQYKIKHSCHKEKKSGESSVWKCVALISGIYLTRADVCNQKTQHTLTSWYPKQPSLQCCMYVFVFTTFSDNFSIKECHRITLLATITATGINVLTFCIVSMCVLICCTLASTEHDPDFTLSTNTFFCDPVLIPPLMSGQCFHSIHWTWITSYQ